MKQLITPVVIIVAMIAFFVMEGKASSRHDDVQMLQGESPSTNWNPMGSAPETKSTTEVSPATEAMVVEPKPVSEITPVTGTKPDTVLSLPALVPVITAEEAIKANEDALKNYQEKEANAKTKDAKIVAETKTGNRHAPAIVPVLTPEEAIKANKNALNFYRNNALVQSFNAFILKNGLSNKLIHYFIYLLPLLLIFDAIFIKRKSKKQCNRLVVYFSLYRRLRILLSVSLLAFGIFIFVPWSVYFGNSINLPFIFNDFVIWNLCVLMISIFGASIILLLIPPGISDYLVATIAGLGLCVYIQAMFMNQHLGTMDGMEPVWSQHRIFGIINIIVWGIIVFIPIVLKKVTPIVFSKVISITTGVVLSLEIVATVSMLLSAGQNVWLHEGSYYVNGSNQFQLSKEKNAVVIVMDALDSQMVKACFEIAPETKEIVKDFIWYADAHSSYLKTFPGLSLELTGSLLVLPVKNFNDLFDKLWHTASAKSFYNQMNDAGYDIRLYVNQPVETIGRPDCYHEYFSNVEARPDITYKIDYYRISNCLMQMSGYSFSPYFIKKYFFYSFDFADNIVQIQLPGLQLDSKAQIGTSNDWFLKKMSSGITSDANKPVLSFHYILGAHAPWLHDEKCKRMAEPFDNPIPTVRACFFILSEFIRLLKEADLYDNTAILICSDHGGNSWWSDHQEHSTNQSNMTFMIKPFHENKTELTIDESKVQSIDILPTLLMMACGDGADFKDFEGYPSFCVPKDRIRKVYNTVRNKSFPSFDGWGNLNCLEEYDFVDSKTFMLDRDSNSFVRDIPFVTTANENN